MARMAMIKSVLSPRVWSCGGARRRALASRWRGALPVPALPGPSVPGALVLAAGVLGAAAQGGR
eukprot:7942093-Lingulodinium_polyedra.AAC.1